MVQRISIIFLFVYIAITIVAFDMLKSSGMPGYTGAYSEGTCLTCHGMALMPPTGISISCVPALDSGYAAGTSYTVSLTVSEAGRSKFGFDLEALKDSSTNGGTLAVIPGTTDCKIILTAGRFNVLHTGTGNSTANAHTFKFLWTAPSAGFGTVTFYTAAVAANGNGKDDSLDHVFQTSLAISEKATGIFENASSEIKFAISPNPASEYIWLRYSLKNNSSVSAQLYSINGSREYSLFSELQSTGQQNKEIRLPQEILTGIYLLKLSVNGKDCFGKVIVF